MMGAKSTPSLVHSDELPSGAEQRFEVVANAFLGDAKFSEMSTTDNARFLRSLIESDKTTRKQQQQHVAVWTQRVIEATGAGISLSACDLSGLDLSGCDLRRVNLNRANLGAVNLQGACLEDATMMCPVTERLNLRDANLEGVYAHGAGFQISTFAGASLKRCHDITGALFHGVDFTGANLAGANLAGSLFYQCDLSGANFESAHLTGAVFNESILNGVSFETAVLDDAVFTKCAADKLDLGLSTGRGVVFQRCASIEQLQLSGSQLRSLRVRDCSIGRVTADQTDLEGAEFVDAVIEHGSFIQSNLSRCRFLRVSGNTMRFTLAGLAGATMQSCTFANASFAGAKAENMHILESSMRGADFSCHEADRSKPFMARGFHVRDSDLRDSDFSYSYLYRSFFTGDHVHSMRLDGCSFREANLVQSYLAASVKGGDLRRIRGTYMRINQSDFTGADLTGADFYEASMVKTIFAGAAMAGVKAPFFLDRCKGLPLEELDEDTVKWCEDLAELMRKNKLRRST